MYYAGKKSIQEKVARIKSEDRAFEGKVTEHLKNSLGSNRRVKKAALRGLSDVQTELMVESIINNDSAKFKSDCEKYFGLNDGQAGIILTEVKSNAGAQPKQARIEEIMNLMDKNFPKPPNPRDLIELRELGNGQQVAKDLLERFGEDWCVNAMKVLSADEDPSDFLRQSEKLQTALLKEVMKTKFDSKSVADLSTDLNGFLQGIDLDDKNIDMLTNLGDVHDSNSYAALEDKGISHEQRVGMAVIFTMVQAPIQSALKETDIKQSAMIGKLFKQFQVEELTGQEDAFLDAAARLGRQYYERLEQNPKQDIESLLDGAPEQIPTQYDPAVRAQFEQAEQQALNNPVEQNRGLVGTFRNLASTVSKRFSRRMDQGVDISQPFDDGGKVSRILDEKPEPEEKSAKSASTYRILTQESGPFAAVENRAFKGAQTEPSRLQEEKTPTAPQEKPIGALSQDQKSQMKIEAKISYFEKLVESIQQKEGDYPLLTKQSEGFSKQIGELVEEMSNFDNLNQSEMLHERVDTLCQSAIDLGGASQDQKQALEGIKLSIQSKMPEPSAESDQTSDIDAENQPSTFKM